MAFDLPLIPAEPRQRMTSLYAEEFPLVFNGM